MRKIRGLERELQEKVTVDCQTGQLIEGITHFHRTNTPANIYLFKVNNRNIGIILMFLMLTWNIFHTFFNVSTVDPELWVTVNVELLLTVDKKQTPSERFLVKRNNIKQK